MARARPNVNSRRAPASGLVPRRDGRLPSAVPPPKPAPPAAMSATARPFAPDAPRPTAGRARARRTAVAGTLCACVALAGCSTMHVKRATYQMLRQEDCRLNQLESFCRRNFSNEYHEYERLRRAFIRESSEEAWRVSDAASAIRSEDAPGIGPATEPGTGLGTAPEPGPGRDAAVLAVVQSGVAPAPSPGEGAADAAIASALRAAPRPRASAPLPAPDSPVPPDPLAR